MKKLVSVLLVAVFALTMLVGCQNAAVPATSNENSSKANDIKVGFIFLHDENSTYDKNFMDAAKAVQAELGLSDAQVMFKTNIPESNECYEAAAELVDAGCALVFADSFGHEDFMIQAAKEFTDVQFCHATGTQAHTLKLANFHNAFASIYQGRFLAGVAAGLKLNEMIKEGKFTEADAKMGYVGAFPYAEVKSGLTSFYLGAKYICPSVTMDVQYTNSWFDIAAEKEAALSLIADGCVLISQHADSEGAPKACEENSIPNVAYNINTASIGPNTALISSAISWEPYMKLIIESVINGTEIPFDYCSTLENGGVILTELNEKVAAEGTMDVINDTKAKLISGELQVFDTDTFTVKGEALTSYMADVDTDAAFTPDTEAISDGYFHESEMRSAPYFDLDIDGIITK